MKGTGRLRWFGPLLASRVSREVFTNRTGSVEVVDELTCQAWERDWFDLAAAWLHAGVPDPGMDRIVHSGPATSGGAES